MIIKKIEKEVKDYKEKLIFGLTARQIIWTIITLLIAIPVYLFTKPYLGDEVSSWLTILSAIIPLSIGFLKYNGMSFDKFLVSAVKTMFILPQKRPYKIENVFEELEKEADKEDKYKKKSSKKRCNK